MRCSDDEEEGPQPAFLHYPNAALRDGTLEALQVRVALLELLSDDLALALELIAAADDERGGLRTLLGFTRQVVPDPCLTRLLTKEFNRNGTLMPSPSLTSTLYTVLGFLDEYIGRLVIRDGDMVEHFYVNEKEEATIFEHYLRQLIDEMLLQTTLRREEKEGHAFFYSAEITRLIDSCYLNHGLTGFNPDGSPAYTEERGFFSRHTGKIAASIFPPDDRDARLAFLTGAHHRYGEQNSFRFANSWHKAQLVKQLLFELGCPQVVMIYSHPEAIPSTFRIGFEPTAELIRQFELKLPGVA